MTSALTNTSSKSILNAFPKPVTLTIVQFACVSLWCLIFAYLASVFPGLKAAVPALKNGIRYPSKEVISTAMPLAVFQLLGHLLSSTATSKIPVSLVHTIKGLSPLFTVVAYRLFFRIRYARATYLSLVPLTVGVMLACSTDFSGNFVGIMCALVAALVFVTQNIFSKKVFNEASRADADGNSQHSRKLDKLNLLCYCSGGAFLLTAPVWLLSEGFTIVRDIWRDGAIDLSGKKGSLDHGALLVEFVFNGIFHFGQNIMAFILLSMLSPVSYSVASLIKRVWVIVVAIIWFRNPTTSIQAFGVALTFFGLYLYDRNSVDDAAERRAKADHFRSKAALLPLTEEPETKPTGDSLPRPEAGLNDRAYEFPGALFKKEDDAAGVAPSRSSFQSTWLPPGTRQESTWEAGDERDTGKHDENR
jgi:solute carrier family 35, member E1